MFGFRLRSTIRRIDWVLVVSTVLLVSIGLAMLFSITLNTEQPHIEKFYRQLLSFGIGLVVLVVMTAVEYRYLRSYAWVIYGASLALLIGVLIFGITLRGTTGWFRFFSVTFQPVELVKVLIIVVLSRYFADHADDAGSWRVIVTSGAIVAAPVALVIAQHDLGSALVPIIIWAAYLVFFRTSWRRLLAIAGCFAVIAVLGWFTLQGYQRDRILTFINPNRDPLRSGYNVRQAIVAIGSGNLFGRGLGLGTQSQLNFLPTQETDFIFAVIAEELGLVGVLVLLSLFVSFLLRMTRALSNIRDPFGAFLLIGLLALFGSEIVMNIAGNVGLLPLTGIPLPFLSYGGSALISSLLAVGIALGVVARSSSPV